MARWGGGGGVSRAGQWNREREREPEFKRYSGSPVKFRKKPRRENFPPFNLGCPGFLRGNPVAPIAESLKISRNCSNN